MKIGIIDAEIIGKTKHRFPNLCSMKLSSYHKSRGDSVELLLSYKYLCYYCVNRNCKRASAASPLSEFMDESRPKLCFLDDNFFSYPGWEELLQPVIESGKRFQFKQGLDERLLTEDKIRKLSKWKYDGEVIFAFDNIEDRELIMSKLMLIRATVPEWTRELKFYVFCGCDKNERYDEAFWKQDIENLFERIFILKTFNCKPYIKYKRDIDRYLKEVGWKGAEWRSMEMIENRFPEIAEKYFDFTGKPPSKYEWLDILLSDEEVE